VYIQDDTGAYGEGIANSFEQRANEKGITILGHDKLAPKESDYTTVLTKIAALNPGGLYYGGVQQAGEKLAAQAKDVLRDARRKLYRILAEDSPETESAGEAGDPK